MLKFTYTHNLYLHIIYIIIAFNSSIFPVKCVLPFFCIVHISKLWYLPLLLFVLQQLTFSLLVHYLATGDCSVFYKTPDRSLWCASLMCSKDAAADRTQPPRCFAIILSSTAVCRNQFSFKSLQTTTKTWQQVQTAEMNYIMKMIAVSANDVMFVLRQM